MIAYRIGAHERVDYSPADAIVDSPAELRVATLEAIDRESNGRGP